MEASIQITNPSGLHARPAVKLAQIASQFDANVQLRIGEQGDWIKAKSTSKLMKLKARTNATIHFRADGQEASNAIEALVSFVRRNFDESETTELKIQINSTEKSAQENSSTRTDNQQTNEIVHSAKPISKGLAFGDIHYLQYQNEFVRVPLESWDQEIKVFKQAIDNVIIDLKKLSRDSNQLGSDIIAFQISLLNDDDFILSALQKIEVGLAAHDAWREILTSEIEDYENSQDKLLVERTSDLRDLCDRVLAKLCEVPVTSHVIPDHVIVMTSELTPSQFLEINWHKLAGAVVNNCSKNSHVALLARAQGVPLLSNLTLPLNESLSGKLAILDAENGKLIVNPAKDVQAQYQQRINERQFEYERIKTYLSKPAQTSKGQHINVYINIDDPMLLEDIDSNHCDGIGLARTEFQFYNKAALPDEDEQFDAYRRLVEWAKGKIITIRTLDAGGDKPIPDYTLANEANPFLGLRGIRLSLANPEILKVQIRALARAATLGPLRVMLPIVTTPDEFTTAKNIFIQQVKSLQTSGVDAKMPSLGMMVEVPAAALTISEFEADFFCIGTNDLVQYVMAASRDCEEVSHLYQSLHPAVIELIGRVVEHGVQKNKEVSICGDMAATPENIEILIKLGVKSLSVPPINLAEVKATIANI